MVTNNHKTAAKSFKYRDFAKGQTIDSGTAKSVTNLPYLSVFERLNGVVGGEPGRENGSNGNPTP